MAIIPTQVHSTLLEPGPEELQDGHGPVARRCGRISKALYSVMATSRSPIVS